ncbi:MAG: peptidase U32 family protein [Syntrophomonadaceae bacterium]|jgi:putative protease
MKQNTIELLAPAGNWEAMEKAVKAGADAIYLGGKRFNMRMLRPDLNFSDQELADAAEYLHTFRKKLYITVNNLYYNEEIPQISDYLAFLEKIKVDALIIQDLALVKIHKQMGLTIPLHASVQMGISSVPAAQFMEKTGFKRAILSKNLTLKEIVAVARNTTLGLEYFAHGDLCIAHTGQCYMSSFIAGRSANRGCCVKPCRWAYKLETCQEEYGHYLAHNDLCLFPYLKELINAGISSFKIEGRMRDPDFVAHLISAYRNGLDQVLNRLGPDYNVADDYLCLQQRRVRNFTVGSLLGRQPEENAVDPTGEREPYFPSSPVLIETLKKEDYSPTVPEEPYSIQLNVKVGDLGSFERMLAQGVNGIIIGLEEFRQQEPKWDWVSIDYALAQASKSQVAVFLETPRIVVGSDIDKLNQIFDLANLDCLEAVIVNDLGSMQFLQDRGLKVRGGVGLNLTNQVAAEFLRAAGLSHLTASLELDIYHLEHLATSGINIEVIIHGPLCGIITDVCLAKNQESCQSQCLQKDTGLIDSWGQVFQIKTDKECRNHIFSPFDRAYFNYLPRLARAGIKHVRIDGHFYSKGILYDLVSIYIEALQEINEGRFQQFDNYERILKMFPRGLTAR